MSPDAVDPGSFRDPSGFVFSRGGELLRQVDRSYREHYDHLLSSGLYRELVERRLLVEHEELPEAEPAALGAYKILRPHRVTLLTYPYEWCFGQLQAAALATLEVQRIALERGMTLKDASAYNVQFVDGRPLLIDTLSFERRDEGAPWVAYRQFCQHFLAPLAVASRRGPDLRGLLLAHLDGLPLDLASALLPRSSWLAPSLLMHVHLHARSQRRYAGQATPAPRRGISRHQQLALVESLRSAVERLAWRPEGTVWADYYRQTSYRPEDEEQKAALVKRYLQQTGDGPVIDLGANTGRYSRVAAALGRPTVSCDLDPAAVERNYRRCMEEGETRILPMVVDLANPSPALGWAGRERAAWIDRFAGHTLLALALVHHLAIAGNVPLPKIAALLRDLGAWLVIEFVPKSDPQVERLLASRKDVFPGYTREGFEAAFGERFEIVEQQAVGASERRIYLMRGRSPGSRESAGPPAQTRLD